MKAIIIGAGIGGLAAAIGLRQAGWEAVIYERTAEIREVGAGLSLWPNAVKALQKLGMGEAINALSIPQLGGGIHTWKGEMLVGQSGEALKQRYGMPVIVAHRAELQSALANAVPPELVHLSAQLTHFEQNSQGVIAHFDDGKTVQGDVLIGADGIKSVVRGQLFPASTPRYAGYTAWRGVTDFAGSTEANYWGESWGHGKRFGLAPLSSGRAYWFATQNAPEGNIIPVGERKAYLRRLFQGWHHPIETLIETTDEAAILHNDIYDIAPLKSWIDGRVALLGDAAHAMTPNLGQGACQAIEDAVVLGAVLRDAADVPTALHMYETRRLARATGIQSQSQRIGMVGQWANPLACWVRDRLVKASAGLQTRQLDSVVGYEV